MRKVRVHWENPVGLDVVLKLGGDNDYGLYQIYSHHVVFGRGALVYIGMAADQTFRVRFKQHEAYWLLEENDVEIRVVKIWFKETNTLLGLSFVIVFIFTAILKLTIFAVQTQTRR